jgi:hypothetical protein
MGFVYSGSTLCLKHTNQKSENEQQPTGFWCEVQVLLAEKCSSLDVEKAGQNSLFSVCCRPLSGFPGSTLLPYSPLPD